MLRQSKWIKTTTPEAPLTELAHEALWSRLNAVWHYLTLAAHQSERDREYVHQLRVWTRRSAAALYLFGDVLPPRRARRLKRQLHRIRGAAAEARDYDVLIERLTPWLAEREGRGATELLSRLRRQRRKAQRPIERVYGRLKRRRFDWQVARLLQKLRWRGPRQEPSFARAAHDGMRAVSKPFFEAAAGELHEIEQLHALRLLGKRLRYAMELFTPAFDSTFRDELYGLVEDVQERLGDIADHATALAYFEDWLARWDDSVVADPLVELVATEQAQLRRSRQRFLKWWSSSRLDELSQQFHKLLSGGGPNQAA